MSSVVPSICIFNSEDSFDRSIYFSLRNHSSDGKNGKNKFFLGKRDCNRNSNRAVCHGFKRSDYSQDDRGRKTEDRRFPVEHAGHEYNIRGYRKFLFTKKEYLIQRLERGSGEESEEEEEEERPAASG